MIDSFLNMVPPGPVLLGLVLLTLAGLGYGVAQRSLYRKKMREMRRQLMSPDGLWEDEPPAKASARQERDRLKLLEYQNRLRVLNHQLALVEDRQRRELASAIHDGLAQQLFGIRAKVTLLKYPDRVENPQEIVQEVMDILDRTMLDARNLSFELFPPVLYEMGLEEALDWLVRHFSERTSIRCRVVTEGDRAEVPEDVRSMVYHCIRELLANVTKHAEAGEVTVTLDYIHHFLTILVEDDGKGFDVAREESRVPDPGDTKGIGLFSIRERLRVINGRMLVDSKPGRGCRVFLSFPLEGVVDG
jgi:signal transduction histidine kinase